MVLSTLVLTTKNIPSRYDKYPNLVAEDIGSTYDCPQIWYRKFNNTYGCYIKSEINKPVTSVLYGN